MARRRQPPARSRRRSRDLLVEALEGRRLLAGIAAVGSDANASSTPLVRLVDAETGFERASVMAFESTFRGGVRLAMGRLTGNTAADLVVGSGSGRPGEVRVFKPVGATLQQVLAFNPFGTGYRGGLEVAVGDIDGDSVEDIVVAKSREGGEVRVFRVTNPGVSPAVPGGTRADLYATIVSPFGASYNGGSSVGVADVGEFRNGAFVKSVGDNKVEILVGSGAGITAQVLVYDVSRPAAPRVADTILPAFNAAYGQPFTGGVTVSSGRYAASGVADSIDEIVISAGRGGSGAVQTIIYDGTVSAATNAIRRGFATYGSAERPNAAVFTAAVDADGNGQVDRFLVTQGDPGGPAGIASVPAAGVRSAAVTSLAGPLRIATPRTVFQPQTINGTVATPSPTDGVAAGASRPMQIREIVTGSGAVPATWDGLTVQYTGMLTNGTVFDSSRQAGRSAFTFTLGAGGVIPGWEAGFAGMKVGGRRLLVIPPELGYGDEPQRDSQGRTIIPARSTLVFDVELVAVTANRSATIFGTSTGPLTAGAATTTTGGALTVIDPDDTPTTPVALRQSVFRAPAPASLAGTYGTFTFNATSGAWTYALDNARPATQALTAGQSVTDSLTVTSRDGTASRTISVTVTGANDVASISGTSTEALTEDDATTSVGGTLTVADGDAGQAGFAAPGSLDKTHGTFTFTRNAANGVWTYTLDNTRAATQGLKAGQQVTDSLVVASLDGSASRTIEVTITGAADAPTDISLSATSIAENASPNATVGTFTTTDADVGDTFTYELVSGTGDTDNGSFAIDGATLKAKDPFDFETKSSYSILVRSTDGAGLSFDKQFTITVTNANDAPTNISLSATTVAENAAAGTVVGTLSTIDADAGTTFTYELVSGTGDTNNASFTIDGATLKTAASFNFETKSSYAIRVRSTDAGGLFTDKQFTITVANVNEAPTDISLSAATVAENTENGTTVGTFTTTDADVGDTLTYELASGTGGTDNGSFTIDGSTLKTNASFNFETKSNYSILVRSTDAGGLFVEKQFTITVTNASEAASISGPATGALTEDDATTTVDGTLVVTDPDTGEAVFAVPAAAALAGTYGDFTFNAAGEWTYTLDNARAVTQALTPGQEVTDSLVVTSLDGTASETITVTITGVAISGMSKGSIDAESETTTTGGTLVVSVPDAAEPFFAEPDSLGGVYGAFTFDVATGDWTYEFDASRYWAWVLTSDRPVTDSLTVTSVDGTASKTIEVTITGYTMQSLDAVVTHPNASVPPGTVSSLQYRDIEVGTGDTAEPGMLVAVHYIGYLDDASLFDSSLLPDRTYFVFQLDADEVIAGWDAGVAGMKVGGARVLVIPPELAYGNSGKGDIPPGARLSFIVFLLAVANPAT